MNTNWKGSGGTEGGIGIGIIGLFLIGLSSYLLVDSVKMTTGNYGVVSQGLRSMGGGWETTSMLIVFMPFIIGTVGLFYNHKMQWAFWLTFIGFAIIGIEVLSRIKPMMTIKLSHLLILFVMMTAGMGLLLRSFKDAKQE